MNVNLTQAKLSRWSEILSSCDQFGYLTTSQIQRLHNLGGRRNALRILHDMSDYLHSFREGETVWYLNSKGRQQIGSQNVRRRTLHVQHTIMRNEVYIALRPDVWKPEYAIKWDDQCIIADALMRVNGEYTFLEVDITQSMAQNKKKIEAYKALRDTGRWQQKFGVFPGILFVTSNECRRKKLSMSWEKLLKIKAIRLSEL